MARGANARKKAKRRKEQLAQLETSKSRELLNLQLREWFERWTLEMIQRLRCSITPDSKSVNNLPAASIRDRVRRAFEMDRYVERQIGTERLPQFRNFAREQIAATIVSMVQAACRRHDLSAAIEFCRAVKDSADRSLRAKVDEQLQAWLDVALEPEVRRRANSLWAKASDLPTLIAEIDSSCIDGVRDHVTAALEAVTRIDGLPLYATVQS